MKTKHELLLAEASLLNDLQTQIDLVFVLERHIEKLQNATRSSKALLEALDEGYGGRRLLDSMEDLRLALRELE